MKRCKICHKEFIQDNPNAKYCPACRSDGGANAAFYSRMSRKKRSHLCIDCKEELVTPGAKRCKKCSHIYEGLNRMGQHNARWKGGRWQSKDGYVKILKKDHPRAARGYVLEHICVWEEAHGILPPDYIIHHVNGIRHDNRLVNLLALSKGQHHFALLQRELQKRICNLEAELSQQRLDLG